MNKVRKRIIENITPYVDFAKHKDLIAFTVGESYFYCDNDEENICGDFDELIVVVEKEWLFALMFKQGIENPLDYLQNEYTWDDSYEWFVQANIKGKIAVIEFY